MHLVETFYMADWARLYVTFFLPTMSKLDGICVCVYAYFTSCMETNSVSRSLLNKYDASAEVWQHKTQ